jgi:hypothetical protein
MPDREQSITASGLNVLAGIWLIISPYIVGFAHTPAATNAITIGIIVGILALIRVMAPENTRWLSWINIILGIWLLISPFIMGFVGGGDLWNAIILGILVIVFAAWSSAAARPSIMAR